MNEQTTTTNEGDQESAVTERCLVAYIALLGQLGQLGRVAITTRVLPQTEGAGALTDKPAKQQRKRKNTEGTHSVSADN